MSLIPHIFSTIALLFAVIALISARRAVRWTRDVTLPQLKKADIAHLSAELSDLRDAYSAMLASHKKLRSRISMRERRDRANGADDPPGDVPDWRTDPAGWKRAMRLKHLR